MLRRLGVQSVLADLESLLMLPPVLGRLPAGQGRPGRFQVAGGPGVSLDQTIVLRDGCL